MKYSFKSIVESLPVKKNSKSSWWVKLWVRRFSFIPTWIFINMGMSSNAVTVLSIFVTLCACTLFCLKPIWCIVTAVVLINFWLVLDCVDGNIARCLGKKKLYGEFVDAMGGYFTVAFVYLALGVAAFNQNGIITSKIGLWIVIVGAVSSISDILARLIYTNYRAVLRPGETESEETKLQEDHHSINWIRKRISKELGISGLFMPLTIVGLLFNCYDFITVFYCLFNGFALLSTAVIYFHKANKYDSI